MSKKPELANILHQLQEVDTSDIIATERQKREKTTAQRRKAESGEDAMAAANWAQSRHILNLDELSFAQGSHFMSNKKCTLPEGSYRKQKKSYEVVYVPALKPEPFGKNEVLMIIFFTIYFFRN